jgi:hypothetical protein
VLIAGVGTRPTVSHFNLPPTPTPTVNPSEPTELIHGHGLRRQPALTRSISPWKQFYEGPLSPPPVPQYQTPFPPTATEMRPDTPSPMTPEQHNSRFTPLGTPTVPEPVRTVAEVKFPHLKGKEPYHAVSEYLRNQYREDDKWMEDQVRQQKEATQRSIELERERQFVAMHGDAFPDIDLRMLIRTQYPNLRGEALLAAVERFMEQYQDHKQQREQEELKKPKYRSIRATPAQERMAYRASIPCPDFVFPLPKGEEESMEMETFDHPPNDDSVDYTRPFTSDTYPANTSKGYPMQTVDEDTDVDDEPISTIHDFAPRPAPSYSSLSSRNRYNLSIAIPPATHPAYGTKLDVSPKIAVRETIEESADWAQQDGRAERIRETERKLTERSSAVSALREETPFADAPRWSTPPPLRHIQGLSEKTKKRLARERKERLKMDEQKRREKEDKETNRGWGCGCVVI